MSSGGKEFIVTGKPENVVDVAKELSTSMVFRNCCMVSCWKAPRARLSNPLSDRRRLGHWYWQPARASFPAVLSFLMRRLQGTSRLMDIIYDHVSPSGHHLSSSGRASVFDGQAARHLTHTFIRGPWQS